MVNHPWISQRCERGRVFEYIEVFYNRKRRHSKLGYQSPSQYLSRWAETLGSGQQAA